MEIFCYNKMYLFIPALASFSLSLGFIRLPQVLSSGRRSLAGAKPCQSALDNPFVAVRNPFGFYFNQSSHAGLAMASIADELDDSCALFTHSQRNTSS